MSEHARQLTLVDCISIGINGVVGSGIYLLVSPLARVAGPASVMGTFVSSILCIGLALCFAELGGMFDRNGGAYVYTRAAFGGGVAFPVAWLGMAQGVVSFAAVAVGFGDQLSQMVPALHLDRVLLQVGKYPLKESNVVSVALVVGLGAINYIGVKAGARTSNVLSALKLIPLILLAVIGLMFVRGVTLASVFSTASLPASAHGNYLQAVSSSAFGAIFMLSGFEYVAVPAGEAKSARRTIPIAIIGSLVGAALLYALLQLACFSVLPNVAGTETPLLDLAQHLLGPGSSTLMGIAGLVSMAGFCAGSALVGPRYFSALAEDGYLPRGLATLSKHGTPTRATLVATALSAGLALLLGYTSLVDTVNVALFGQYIPVALAALVLRYKMPNAPRSYKLPGGPIIPGLATISSVLLLWKAQPKHEEWIFSGELLAIGVVVWGSTQLIRWWRGPRGAAGVV